MAFTFFTAILFLLSLLTQISESRISRETLTTVFGNSKHSHKVADQGTNWAVLVAGSNGYGNYRHQADICHAYQILKKGGLKDENIVVFMYDDIANNEENPNKGIIINNPKGGDVYKGVPKDYTGDSLTTSNLLAAILGDKKSIKGGSGKVVNSGPNDRIFIYYSDHGSPGVLTMPGDDDGGDLYAKDFISTLKKKYDSGTYKSMVIYVEACEAGSIFEGLLPNNWNIYVTTASNSEESSWATYCPGFEPGPPSGYDTCLGDLYSVAWMEDSDAHNLGSESLEQQYKVVLKRTADDGDEHGSHVMQYGTLNLDEEFLSFYLGRNPNVPKNHTHKGGLQQPISSQVVEQHEADILYLRQKALKAKGTIKEAGAQKELDDALSHRKQVDYNFESIGKTLFGAENGFDIIKTVRPAGQPIVDDWDCFKSMVNTYKSYCGPLSTYGKKHMRAFANVCNAGVEQGQMAKAASQICGNKLKK